MGRKVVLKKGTDLAKITVDNTVYSHYAVAMRAVRKIQSSFRSWKLRMRIATLSQIARYIATIDSNVIHLEQNVYCNLKRLEDGTKKSLFMEQHFNFKLIEKEPKAKVNFPRQYDRSGRYTLSNFP